MVGASTSSSYVYAEHVYRNLNRTLELWEISHHLFKVQASIPILGELGSHFLLERFCGRHIDSISIWSKAEYEET
jgi:hypothetical protein